MTANYQIGDKVSNNGKNYTANSVIWYSMVAPPNGGVWNYESDCGGGTGTGNILDIPEGKAIIPTWKNGATGAYTMICDDFGGLPFDDAFKPVWDLARESQFSEIKLAFGAIAGQTSNSDWDSAVVMVSQGHEIINHSVNHSDPQSWSVHVPEAAEANAVINEKVYGRINTAGEYFAKGKKCEFFIFPYDNVGGYDILDNAGLVGARGGQRADMNTLVMNGDFTYNYSSFTEITNPEGSSFKIPFTANQNTVSNMKATIDNIISKKGYLIREFHAIYEKKPNGWNPVSKAEMRTHFEYLKQKMDANELAVYTPSELVKHRKTALAFETDADLTTVGDNWKVKLKMKKGESVADKYKDEISVIVNLGVSVENLSVAYDGNLTNTNSDNSPRTKPKKMDTEGKIWSISINPFKTTDNSALLIRDGEWFGQGVDIITCEICGKLTCTINPHVFCDCCEIYDCGIIHIKCPTCGECDCDLEDCELCGVHGCDGSCEVSIRPDNKNNHYGLQLLQNPVSGRAEIIIILPNNEKIASVQITIYDNLGNIVFVGVDYHRPLTWDLRNQSGRFVSNGSYLIIASVKTQNGIIYHYSSKLGVKR